jgi:ferredoxin
MPGRLVGALPGRPTLTFVSEPLRVWVDQDLCTGDGLCVQYAPEVFEFDVDGLAYVKGQDGELRTASRSAVDVPERLRLDVLDSARECPGECIHVERAADGVAVAGPDATPAPSSQGGAAGPAG